MTQEIIEVMESIIKKVLVTLWKKYNIRKQDSSEILFWKVCTRSLRIIRIELVKTYNSGK